MNSVLALFALAIAALTPLESFAQNKIDVRAVVGDFFDLAPLEGDWTFKSLDGRCEFEVSYWEDAGVVQIQLRDDKGELGTAFRAITHREETVPLFNQKSYFSYYSDFSQSSDHMFVVDGIYEFIGEPGDKGTRKIHYLTRSLHIQAQNDYRYVTYTATDRQGVESKVCLF